ncbi:hypothetical protein IF1G_04440 [Cordyceps javanica]|uniref:Uncharacterized protein n=1 Tax=Cordyceps javanica TaxID=43265 RepID=A0A545V655_9HYPO|nr:hypothetical protein IF1G_04440 [Cordyceps javanica]
MCQSVIASFNSKRPVACLSMPTESCSSCRMTLSWQARFQAPPVPGSMRGARPGRRLPCARFCSDIQDILEFPGLASYYYFKGHPCSLPLVREPPSRLLCLKSLRHTAATDAQ